MELLAKLNMEITNDDLQLKPLTVENGKNLKIRKEQYDFTGFDVINYIKVMQNHSTFSCIVVYKDIPLFIVNVIELWQGVGEIYLVVDENITKTFAKCRLSVVKLIKNYLNSLGYARLQCSVKEDFKEGHKFVKFLGFEYEGTMRNYGPSHSNYLLYSRVE